MNWLFVLLGTLCLALFGVSVAKTDWSNSPLIERFMVTSQTLFITAICLYLVSGRALLIKGLITPKPLVVEVRSQSGEIYQKATIFGIRKEIKEMAAELGGEAETYFKSGESDFGAEKYADAAKNYEKSINIIPTMAGYQNLGLSYLSLRMWDEAEKALTSGYEIAVRRSKDQKCILILSLSIGGMFFRTRECMIEQSEILVKL